MSYTQYLTATPSRTGNNTLFLRHFYSLRLWMKETWEKEYGEGSFEHIQNVGRFFFTAPIIDDLLNRCEEICAAHRKYGRSLNRQDIQIAHKLLPDEYRYWTPKACADDYNSDYFQNVKNLKNFLKKNHNKAITWEQD